MQEIIAGNDNITRMYLIYSINRELLRTVFSVIDTIAFHNGV